MRFVDQREFQEMPHWLKRTARAVFASALFVPPIWGCYLIALHPNAIYATAGNKTGLLLLLGMPLIMHTLQSIGYRFNIRFLQFAG